MLDFLVENTQEEETMADKYAETKAKYDKENTRLLTFKLNLKTDADILKKLDSVPNRQGYMKELIRADISNGNNGISKVDILARLRAIERALEGLDI